MPDTYDYITLLCRLKAAQTRIKELESGERYIHLRDIPSSKAIKRKKIANSRKKQDGNRAVSRGIPATAEKNRNPHSRSSFFLHLKKSWKTVISKRPEEQS